MQVRGRHLIIGWTAIFFVAVVSIVRREYNGWKVRRAVDSTDAQLKQLNAMMAGVDADIAAAASRDSLVPKAEALGLRFVSDSNLVSITVPGHR